MDLLFARLNRKNMDTIRGASASSSSQTHSLVIEREASKLGEEQITDIEDHPDSWESSSDSESGEKHILLADHKQKIHKLKKQFEEKAAGEQRNKISGIVINSQDRVLQTNYEESIQDYVTTETETDSRIIFIKSRKNRHPSQILKQKLAAERQKTRRLNKALHLAEGRKLRSESQDNPIDSTYFSPLERIHSYFDSLKGDVLIKKTILQLLTGIALRNKKAGIPLPNLPSNNASEVYKFLNAVSSYPDTWIADLELNEHYEKIKKCLEDIGPESDIIYINEKILAAIRGQFDRDKRGNVLVQLDDAIKELNLHNLKGHEHNAVCIAELTGLFCCFLLLFTRTIDSGIPLFKEICVEQDRKRLIRNLSALYQEYDGLQLRNVNGSPLERLNSYFDSLKYQSFNSHVYQNLLKQTILWLQSGIVLYNKKAGEPLSDLPDKGIREIYELIDESVHILNALDEKHIHRESDDWDLSTHYKKIIACFENIGPESDIQYIDTRISEEIKYRFYMVRIWKLEHEIFKIVHNNPKYLKKNHKHDETCQIPTGNIFVKLSVHFSRNNLERKCLALEQKKLKDKLMEIHERYTELQRRQTIRFQKMSTRELANQKEQASSSRNAQISERITSNGASPSTPLLDQRTAAITSYTGSIEFQ